jgi:hypothetical protein
MRRTCVYTISVLAFLLFLPLVSRGQDTVMIPLKINAGIELIGPVTYAIEKNTLSAGAYVSADLSEKWAAALNAGYLDYKYSQYNYDYLSRGFYFSAGADFNILKPKKTQGKYWGGLSLRYGLSNFRWEVPLIRETNVWGEARSSLPPVKNWGHFLQASPGMRAEVFRNFSMGWTIDVRMLLYTGKSEGIRPIYFPGFGNSDKRFSTGFSYYLVWNIPYKKLRIIIQKPEPEEEEDIEEDNTQGINQNQSQGIRQQRQQPNSAR